MPPSGPNTEGTATDPSTHGCSTVLTDRSAFRETARTVAPGTRVPVTLSLTVDDPLDAYRRARDDNAPESVYLATTGGQSGWGYFAVDPIDSLTVGPDSNQGPNSPLTTDRPARGDADPGDAHRTTESALAALSALLESETLVRGDCPVPYPCGAIGWLSYDLARELESLPTDATPPRPLAHLDVRVYDRLVAWREPRDSDAPVPIFVTACPSVDPDEPDAAFDRGLERARELRAELTEGDPTVGRDTGVSSPGGMSFESDAGPAAFAARARQVKERVRAGDTFQANVSHRLTAPAAIHPLTLYDALRRVNPAPYSALLEFPDIDLVSASPELLLAKRGSQLHTEPIAGTRPRGDTPETDAANERDLVADEKERAEHAMLVDLERNDLGKVSAYESVSVPEYRRVDRYASVMHLVSRVEGRLRDDTTLADAIAAVFPGGTITGAPKPRTMAIIDALEPSRRGPYTGSIGIFGFETDQPATLNILIRTFVRIGDTYSLRVGAGIVHDSIPEREYEETLAKAGGLLDAIDTALDGIDRQTEPTVTLDDTDTETEVDTRQ